MRRSSTWRYAQSTLPAPMKPDADRLRDRTSSACGRSYLRQRSALHPCGREPSITPQRYRYRYPCGTSRAVASARCAGAEGGRAWFAARQRRRHRTAGVLAQSGHHGGHGRRDAVHPRRVRRRRRHRRVARRDRSAVRITRGARRVGHARTTSRGRATTSPVDSMKAWRKDNGVEVNPTYIAQPRRHPGEDQGGRQRGRLRPDHVLPGLHAALHRARHPHAARREQAPEPRPGCSRSGRPT